LTSLQFIDDEGLVLRAARLGEHATRRVVASPKT
jgi:hypothetical protein